jgi:hypothetical protein
MNLGSQFIDFLENVMSYTILFSGLKYISLRYMVLFKNIFKWPLLDEMRCNVYNEIFLKIICVFIKGTSGPMGDRTLQITHWRMCVVHQNTPSHSCFTFPKE